ncbi:chaperone protein dnaJ 11, chloroplastic-like [Hordeum vulgare subsp. vulgare]|uniref:Predicted protein n=1 Tax=Hordeum vulgare subsp. vulgare TaxID=112509 RepID=F2DDY6_HORVV|nr:chaperone protein dnaJ 11, chloroplastic-like [Hordeum vulgare subsp. vulgare]BAJ93307.1 predicted protein [Hordeum vulgare subsp. vulgare]BAJ95160.1 predicted protein [Hordeum vulgare subsp. vulgare]
MISPRPTLSSGFFSRSASFSRPASFSPRPMSPPASPAAQAPPPLLSAPFARPTTFSRSASFSASAVAAPDRGASPCFYDVLGLDAGASGGEIKAAYRRLARAVHPDVSPHPADDFIRVHAAYSTLSDPSKRADYDRRMIIIPSAISRRSAPNLARSPSFPGCRRRTWETDQCW